MRIFSSRCHRFEYRVTAASPCAVGLEPSDIGVTKPFFDCLLLLVGVERGDLALTGSAVDIVKRIAAQTSSSYIVIDGFAQWAEDDELLGPTTEFDVLASLADALDVLADLAERLEERGELVHLMPFGWSKIRRADVMDGQWTQHVTDVRRDAPAWARRGRSGWSLAPRMRVPCAGSRH
ncbi:hypothetical protein [Nocardia mexicana]|uniref:Threonyl-tRNA synthetase editing subunit n=1 Tax=Nocardia mexicana TaxID=279262 RepID=A0A370H9B7_9NOCA|nr:hypothetical protein [Nocardia mexicana]RDI52624.1 threonyl-tRNA synthetase editing subunit [Nocardia mexicana]